MTSMYVYTAITCKQILLILMQQVLSASHTLNKFNIDLSDLCSQLTYILIFPYAFSQKREKQKENVAPYVVTFRDDTIKFTEILNRYLQLNPQEKLNKKLMTFTLRQGAIINRNMSVKSLKKQLRRDSIEGLSFYVIEMLEVKAQNQDKSEFQNQCGLSDFISESVFDKNMDFLFHFYLPNTSYVVSILINPNKKVSELIQKFVQYVSINYSIVSEQKNQILQIGDCLKDYILNNGTKLSKIIQKQDTTIHQCNYFEGPGENIKVIVHKGKFKKNIRDQFPITLIHKQENNERKSKMLTIRYEEIVDLTVSNLYQIYFLNEAEKKQFHSETKHNNICLKILEYILHPDDTIMKYHTYIEKVKTLGDFKLVGYFVTEKMIFYQQISKLGENYDFQLDQLMITQTQANKKIKQDCKQKSTEFASKRITQLQELTYEKHFKSAKEFLPFVVYSSELQITNPETKEKQTIYYSLNKMLREKHILKIMNKEFQQHWCYKFTSVMLKHLSKIKAKKNMLYRGVNYKLEGKVGQKVTFKSFLSTSFLKNVAINFAVNNQVKKAKQNPKNPLIPLVLFVINASSGKSIQYFSVYPQEKEYLYEPYSEFRIKGIKQQDLQGKRFTVYELQEIVTPKQMPQTINNYLVWVDDKKYQGSLIYHKLISQFYYPTVLFQLKSTQDLVKWINERKVIINDTTKKMIMITNMVRVEDGKKNFYAGVDAINVVNEAIQPNIPIAVYVGDLKSALNNMKEKGCACNNVKAMNEYEDLAKFVAQKIGVKFKVKNEDDIEQLSPQKYNNGNDNKQGGMCEIM